MDDRTMLELAAKAAGYTVNAEIQAARDALGAGNVGLWIDGVSTCWNPIEDSRHAFRLGVKLSLCQAQCFARNPPEVLISYKSLGGEWHHQTVVYNGDPEAATRLAITRAAAEIGKAMP